MTALGTHTSSLSLGRMRLPRCLGPFTQGPQARELPDWDSKNSHIACLQLQAGGCHRPHLCPPGEAGRPGAGVAVPSHSGRLPRSAGAARGHTQAREPGQAQGRLSSHTITILCSTNKKKKSGGVGGGGGEKGA